ncbi:hypothetical protein SAMN04488137_2162 [Fictibacillus solisalsi]|uniref:Uncharacterized protein n=1 Tax=Fictibacillus solisalsi TaxID=459525 RepID=A0A1G9WGH0_9BACL|nr:hypothetical protein [Fictibacillus solisalsi]SDM83654.1 hypothetical protein SAMN04488137_2162 [Fictibacillus solisalsi]
MKEAKKGTRYVYLFYYFENKDLVTTVKMRAVTIEGTSRYRNDTLLRKQALDQLFNQPEPLEEKNLTPNYSLALAGILMIIVSKVIG